MNSESFSSVPSAIPSPSLYDAFCVWLKIGVLSFGGPAAQIALMHREVVDRRQWLSETQFLNALNFCMLLPGPEAMQLATYIGWRLHSLWGGLIAGLLFVLPGALVILVLATVYVTFGSVPLVDALFLGVKATVVVIVIEALCRVSKKALSSRYHWYIATSAFVGIFFFSLPYPFIVVASALAGVCFLRDCSYREIEEGCVTVSRPPFVNVFKTIAVWMAIWWLPILCIDQWTELTVLSDIATFFSTLAVVTFGGAYAVLAYMAQDVVAIKGWLTTGEMMAGLGLAETTPGPLILVTEFVGFFAGFRDGGWLMGVAGAAIALWATFVPCFLWIFAGGPYIDWMSEQPSLRAALAAITAAVVGVILSLSLWFALHLLFGSVEMSHIGWLTFWTPDFTTINWLVLALVCVNGYLLLQHRWGVVKVLCFSSVLSVLIQRIMGLL